MFRLSLVVTLLLFGGSALAQNPQLPQPVETGPVRLQFPNSDINTVLETYERWTRKKLIRDNSSLVGSVYIVVNDPVPIEEAIRIVEINLLMNGFVLVPTEGGKLVKVAGTGKNPRNLAIPIVADRELLPENEQIVSFLLKLQYADPTELVQVLTQAFPPTPALQGQSMVALPKSQALLITENTPIIRSILSVVDAMDLAPAEVESEFITLERADVKDVVEKLKEIFQPAQTGVPGAPVPAGTTVPRPVRPATTPDGLPLPPNATVETTGPNTIEIAGGTTSLSEDSIIVGKIKLSADVRTNRIHVITRRVNLPFIRKLLEEFDSDVKFGEPSERALKFVKAADVLDSVIRAIQDPGAREEGAAAGATAGTRQGQAQTNTRTNRTNQDMLGTDRFGQGSGGGSMGRNNFSQELTTEEVSTIPQAVTVGNTRIIADTRTNTIIVLGNREVKDKIWKVLDHLDVRAPQVALQTVIGQLELSTNKQFGVEYILRQGGILGPLVTSPGTTPGTPGTPGNGNGGTPGTSTSGVVSFNGNSPVLNLNNLLTQRNIRQIGTVGAGGLTGFFTVGNTLNAVVTALESTNRFRVTARPHVFTSNNKTAVIASGQQIAIPTQTLTSLTNVNVNDNAAVSSSIQYRDVTLKLEVVPLINSEREVTLEIVQTVDEVAGSTLVGGNNVPTINTRYIKTTVSVPNKATLVLGGLIRESESRGRSGIPILSRIPLIGGLFGTTTKDKLRSELVILIRPEVSMGPDESVKLRERAQEFLEIEPDLESTFYPPGIREKVPAERILRESAVELRDKALAPDFKK